MKPIANLWKDSKGNRGIVLVPDDPKLDIESTPLYAIDFTKYALVPIEPPQDTLAEYRHYHKLIIEAAPNIEDIKP